MIPCTDFVPAYSDLFQFLHDRGGTEAVEDFWECLSDTFLGNLRSLVKGHGIRGCWMYWKRTLREEAADFTMEMDERAGWFRIRMRRCPSKSRLNALGHIRPYNDYCRHCDVLYRTVLEPLGYDCTVDLSESKRAKCELRVTRRKQKEGSSGCLHKPRVTAVNDIKCQGKERKAVSGCRYQVSGNPSAGSGQAAETAGTQMSLRATVPGSRVTAVSGVRYPVSGKDHDPDSVVQPDT